MTSFLSRDWGILLEHACVFQHVGPLAAGASMAMLEMLTEMIGPVKLLARVAFAKLVLFLQVTDPLLPVFVRGVSRHNATIERSVAGSTT
jgi:hypothetical protein